MVAACYGNAGCVQVLAEKEAKMQDGYNRTALMFAAENGHLECVKILAPLEKGMKNGYGSTAKSLASRKHPDCSNYLSQYE